MPAPTHRMTGTKTYASWAAMLTRCGNPNSKSYPDYGGRGVKVCAAWHDFETFFSDMGERPEGRTLDRIDPNGDYEPGNCRWATRSEQNSNKVPKTHCAKGHEFTPENTYHRPAGGRTCLTCRRAHGRAYLERKRLSRIGDAA